MVAAIEILKRMLPNSKLCLALFVICGIIVYGAILVLTGEVKDELNIIKRKFVK